MGHTVTRKSVPLTEQDLDGVAALRTDHAWRTAALELAGIELSAQPSEAEALHALVEVGHTALRERVTEEELATGYAALRRAQDDEDRQVARTTGRRTAARSRR